MQPWCLGISTLLLSALLPWPGTGKFSVIGPQTPVIALVGKEAVLHCHLSPVMDAEDMQVTWARTDPSGQVHRYDAAQDQLEQQRSEYRGRTEFLKENITTGQVALRIHPILPSDGGEYSCSFTSSTFENKTQFTVLVTASGTDPQIQIEVGGIKKFTLTCKSIGWYPEPEVQWRDLQGQVIAQDSETMAIAENGLFYVETSVTIDSRTRDASCVIRNPVLREEKKAHISLTDSLFQNVWVMIVLITVSLSLLACLCCNFSLCCSKCFLLSKIESFSTVGVSDP